MTTLRIPGKRYLAGIAALALLVAYLLWPLGSEEMRVTDDPAALQGKNAYLAEEAPVPAGARPNIILITVDDLGMADCSLYGEGDILTPNIDRLGQGGVVFENAYVTSPVCAPSRAALITGRYQHRFGFEFTMHDRYLRNRLEYLGFKYFVNSHPWVPQWADAVPDRQAIRQQGLPLSEITLAEVLKKQGYRTAIIGKWHLGWSEEKRPSAFGFEEQYGFFHSHSLYVPEGSPGFVDQKIDGDWTDPHIWSGQRDGAHGIHRNYRVIEEDGYLTDRITDESIAFMKAHADEPFFLWVSYNAPHTPLQAPQEYVNRFSHIRDPVKRVYRAMIASLDDNIGRLTDHLAGAGLDTGTLVFFVSDNGGADYTLTTDNGRYEGGKNTQFEGGFKVPMILSWPGTVPGGMRFNPMVSSLDFLPTAAAAARVAALPDRPIDGVDLLPFLKDTVCGSPHDYLFWKRGAGAVVRTGEWKLMINGNSGDTLLFNLLANRYEGPDVSDQHPGVVDRLAERHREWTRSHRSAMWPPVVYYIGYHGNTPYPFDQ